MKRINHTQVDFSAGTRVISVATKFVIPVGLAEGHGEPLVYPVGHPNAGQPMLDWQSKPIGTTGIVFFNEKDQKWQGAPDGGSAIIIINCVNEQQGEKIAALVAAKRTNPHDLSLDELKEVLREVGQLGLTDVYNSDTKFCDSKFKSVGEAAYQGRYFGRFCRPDRDGVPAVYIPEAFEFEAKGAAAGDSQKYAQGAVVVQVGDGVHCVEPNIFIATYRNADGSVIDLESLPTMTA